MSDGPPLSNLHHLALGTRDVERLAAFYREAFGLREVRRHQDEGRELRSIWLDLGGALLMIEATAAPAPALVQGVGAGLFLLCLRVPAAERAALEQRLEQLGARIESRTQFTSYARDPDGNRIALSHYPDPPSPDFRAA
jgi:catechol 2,3-dioxygenase-like lactoylglutathione lyase family enzyme